MTDSNGEERDFVVVFVEGGDHRVVGVAHVTDLFSCPSTPIHLHEPVKEESCSVHSYRTELIFYPETVEALREIFSPKPSISDLAKLAADLKRGQAMIKAAERLAQTDSIPVPKKYQRNRFKR